MTMRAVVGRVMSVAFLGAGAVALTGTAPVGVATASPPGAGTSPAAVVSALAADDTDTASDTLPRDFAAVMRYEPVVQQIAGMPVLADPQGSCSAPVPLPSVFESACRTHDLGYDLLRYARDTGGELGSDARRALDDMFARHLDAACRSGETSDIEHCLLMARIATSAVHVNSWRQGYRIPVSDPLPYVLATGGALGLAAAGRTPRGIRR